MLDFMKTIVALTTVLHIVRAASATNGTLPIIDLGYRQQSASSSNNLTYTFSNIRYAQAPVGDLRFREPRPPLKDRSQIFDGSDGHDCPSAVPSWTGQAFPFISAYLSGELDSPNAKRQASGGPSEDCLFLDVIVPKDVLGNAGNGRGVPVLVWIYGGGYTLGSKTAYGNPAGLIEQARESNGQGVIYVAMNYRLGAFGFLSGPSFQGEGGISNAALYDQRLALQWIKKYIARFGGCPDEVTVFGESAGAGSIVHQITAFGDARQPPFEQAVIQSPAFRPAVSNQVQESIFNDFLKRLNVSTLDQARRLSSSALQSANAAQVQNSSYGRFTYGPTVDGIFAPQLPGQLLARGQYPKNLKLILGHNEREGLLFTPPKYNLSNAQLENLLSIYFPTANAFPSVVDYITNTLYPNTSYHDEVARSSSLIAETVITCNTFFLDKAYNNHTYSYLFAVPPGIHGQDLASTFYNGARGPLSFADTNQGNTAVALALQGYITHFAIYGTPNVPGVPYFPMYGKNASLQVLNSTGISQITDPTANERCNWWQKALYY